jgi:hypothetical protein
VPNVSRRAVLATIGSLSLAGCSGWPASGTTTEEPTPTVTQTEPPATTSPTENWITEAVNEPAPDHAVYLSNEGTDPQRVRIEVVRGATDEVVFDETQTIDPGTEREVYNLKQASPDGIEEFAICGERVDPPSSDAPPSGTSTTSDPPDSPDRDCITMNTNACYGTAHVIVREDEFQIIYSIC